MTPNADTDDGSSEASAGTENTMPATSGPDTGTTADSTTTLETTATGGGPSTTAPDAATTGDDTEGPETGEDDTGTSGGATCEDGLVACGGDVCDIDLDADPENCGSCGHDCLGGECEQGECQPVALHLEGNLFDLAADEEFVFFSTDQTVERIPHEPMATPTELIDRGVTGTNEKRELADAGSHVLLAGGSPEEGYVLLVPEMGGPAQDLYFDASALGGVVQGVTNASRAF